MCHPQLSNPSFPLRCVRRAATACAAHNRSCVYSSTMGCALLVPVERPAARCLGRGDYYIYYHPEAIANFAASGRCAATFSPRTRALPAQSHACVTLLCGPLRAYRYDDRRPRQNASLPHTQTLGTSVDMREATLAAFAPECDRGNGEVPRCDPMSVESVCAPTTTISLGMCARFANRV